MKPLSHRAEICLEQILFYLMNGLFNTAHHFIWLIRVWIKNAAAAVSAC
jgi:hypothetical protein